jgi:LuxR family maltose regulon positive regulatory protein
MATMTLVAAMLEQVARMQKETAEVLRDLASRTGDEATVQRLSRARDPAHRGLVPVPAGRGAQRDRRPRWPAAQVRPSLLAESLTPREEAVLRLLMSRLSLREISQELFVSLNTVKSHTRAIYRKLSVSTRQEAVQRGRDLAILPG